MKNIIERTVVVLLVIAFIFGVMGLAIGITYGVCAGGWWLICLVISREFLWSEALGFWAVIQLFSMFSMVFYDEHRTR